MPEGTYVDLCVRERHADRETETDDFFFCPDACVIDEYGRYVWMKGRWWV